MTKEQFDKYNELSIYIYSREEGANIMKCPATNCGYLFEPAEGMSEYNCRNCASHYCLACGIPFHKKQTCEEYHAELKRLAEEEAARITKM